MTCPDLSRGHLVFQAHACQTWRSGDGITTIPCPCEGLYCDIITFSLMSPCIGADSKKYVVVGLVV